MSVHNAALEVLTEALGVPPEGLCGVVRIHDHPRWDSLGHISVVEAISLRVGRDVSPEECLTVAGIDSLLNLQTNPSYEPTIHRGLHGIYIDTTSISHIDGVRGQLSYRGRQLSEFANIPFIELIGFLVSGRWLHESDCEDVLRHLKVGMEIGHSYPCQQSGLSAVISSIILCPEHHNTAYGPIPDEMLGYYLTGLVLGTLGVAPLETPHALSRAALAALSGSCLCTPGEVDLFNTFLVSTAEHGVSASTLALRVAASTGATPEAALGAAMLVFSGPRHGGAIKEVDRLLDELVERGVTADAVAADYAANNKAVPGFGHRVYLAEDPRCRLLRDAMQDAGSANDLLLAVRQLEEALRRTTPGLQPNVDLYGACLLRSLGIQRENMPLAFLLARCAGFAAHYVEQCRRNVLMRPMLWYEDANVQGN